MDQIKPQRGFLKPNEVILRENSEWLHFSSPHQIVTAEKLEDVVPALQVIETLIAVNRWYAAGFLSYEAAPAFDAALQTKTETQCPYLWFGLYSEPNVVTLPQPKEQKQILDWELDITRETYNAAITTIKEAITKGKTYQVNYTMRLHANFTSDPWDFFLHLIQDQNDHAAYIDTGRYVICSVSPESFFRLDGNAMICRPMKGTAKRGRTTIEDLQQSNWLQNSAKNRAENVMIVDMIRNDLGKIAEVGSVYVPHLFETERYSTLWQMTSTVTARTDASLTEILRALFPCGSITGAPKVSTMKLIEGLENSPRGVYTGTIGYISYHRKASFNVAIRTLLIDRQTEKAEYGVGGGIVWDSVSADEYEEALLKAQTLVKQHLPFSLLETILWTPKDGFFLLKQHIARMIDSAAYFDIPIKEAKLEEYLRVISSHFVDSQRVRLLLSQAGELSCETKSCMIIESNKTLKVCLAKTPIDSSNIFLFHKTTQRNVYESARKGLEEFDDVLLFNELGELTEFTVGNLVVELDGQLLTPPISCGVLAGTFRAHLIETRQVLERTLTIVQLASCTQLFRVNSVRGWQKVEICDKGNIVREAF